MEIIRGVERRRRWDFADKLRIVAEVEAPGAVFAAVARRHDISRGQLWNWRRQFRSGELGGANPTMPEFLPLCVEPEKIFDARADAPAAARTPPAGKRDQAAPGRIEIMLANGVSIRVEGRVDAALLKAAIAAARG